MIQNNDFNTFFFTDQNRFLIEMNRVLAKLAAIVEKKKEFVARLE